MSIMNLLGGLFGGGQKAEATKPRQEISPATAASSDNGSVKKTDAESSREIAEKISKPSGRPSPDLVAYINNIAVDEASVALSNPKAILAELKSLAKSNDRVSNFIRTLDEAKLINGEVSLPNFVQTLQKLMEVPKKENPTASSSNTQADKEAENALTDALMKSILGGLSGGEDSKPVLAKGEAKKDPAAELADLEKSMQELGPLLKMLEGASDDKATPQKAPEVKTGTPSNAEKSSVVQAA